MSELRIWFNALWLPCGVLLVAAVIVLSIHPFGAGGLATAMQALRAAAQFVVVLAGAWLVRNLVLLIRWSHDSAGVRTCDGCGGPVAAISPRDALRHRVRCWRCGAGH